MHEDSIQVRRHIGYLPENPPLYEHMSVESYLHFVANIKGVAAGDRALAVTNARPSSQHPAKTCRCPICSPSTKYN